MVKQEMLVEEEMEQEMHGGMGQAQSPQRGKKKREDDNQPITTVTLRQLAELAQAQSSQSSGLFKICGKVIKMETLATGCNIVLDDTTGTQTMKYFTPANSGVETSDFAPNTYMKAYVKVNKQESQHFVTAWNLQVVNDYNVITHHLLECVRVHLRNTANPLPQSGAETRVKNEQQMEEGQTLRDIVYQTLYRLNEQRPGEGGTTEEVIANVQEINEHATPEEINKEIQDFLAEGVIVTTIDDAHFVLAGDN